MKTLDLNAYGVQELSHNEMIETGGGEKVDTAMTIIGAVCTVVGVVGLCLAPPLGIAVAIIAAPTGLGMAIGGLARIFKK